MRYFLSLLFIISIFPSCKRNKEGLTTFEGVVKDATDGKPLPNFKIAVISTVSSFGSLDNQSTNEMEIITTDAEGKFSGQFEADDRHYYGINLPEQRNKEDKYCDAYTKLNSAEKNIIEVKAKRIGILKIHVINEPPVEVAEEYHVDWLGGTAQNYFLNDTSVFFTRCTPEDGTINYRIQSSGKLNEGEKKYIILPWDTTIVEIRY